MKIINTFDGVVEAFEVCCTKEGEKVIKEVMNLRPAVLGGNKMKSEEFKTNADKLRIARAALEEVLELTIHCQDETIENIAKKALKEMTNINKTVIGNGRSLLT